MGKKNSLDLFEGIGSKKGSLFINQLDSKRLSEKEKIDLPPIEFFCKHHDIVNAVSVHLSQKYPSEIILNKSMRKKIELESYNDVVSILTEKNLLPKKELVSKYIELIFADILGDGILEPLLRDETVDEIIVQTHDFIIVERHGHLEKTDYKFASIENAKTHVDKIIEPLNKRLNPNSPNVNAQLPDGSRLSASVAPLRANGEISITIRKFSNKVHPLSYYSKTYQSSTSEMISFLEHAVASRQSLIVSGGTGSGKTTLLNSLSMAVPPNTRIITVEDTLELQLPQPFVEAYQTIEANIEGKGKYTMTQVIIDALRKRPDILLVGECRGGEVIEMLTAMNTGHEGSMSTIHANSAKDMVTRVITMFAQSEAGRSFDKRAILQMLDSALSLIVQTNRMRDGSRKITAVTEVVGVGEEGFNILKKKGMLGASAQVNPDLLYLQDIFRFNPTYVDSSGHQHGQFIATGYVPECLEKMREKGVQIADDLFTKRILMEV